MKKTFISLIIMSLFFSSCGQAEKKTEKTENTPAETEVEKEPEKLVKELTYKKFVNDIWNFEESPDSFAYQGKLPCIVDFYADWCGPCRKVTPIMEKLAAQYQGQLIVYKVNTDKEQKLSAILGIKSIPTVFFFPVNGQPAMRVGALSEADYIADINKYLIKK